MSDRELRDKIIYGLELSFKRLISSKSKEDKELFFSENGEIVRIKAGDLEK